MNKEKIIILERILKEFKYWHKKLNGGLNYGTAVAIVEEEIDKLNTLNP